MAERVEDPTREMLRRTHSQLDGIQTGLHNRFTDIETRLAALEHCLAASYAVEASSAAEIANLGRRIERPLE
jgi:hypothetical protein